MADEIQDAGGKTTGFLKKKMGPLELWQWGVGVVGLFAAYLAYKSFTGGGQAAAASTSPSVSTVPPSDTATTGANTTLSGQVGDVQTTLGNIADAVASLPSQIPTAVQSNPTPGSSGSGAVGGFANWQAFENSPAALSLAQTNPNAYVTAQYNDVLGRAPDAPGLAFWQGQLGSNPTQAQVVAENQQFLGATGKEIAARQVATGQ